MVAAAFHPERPSIFVLAFADGTVAAYDAVYLFREGDNGNRRSRPTGIGQRGEISHLKRVHAVGFTFTPARSGFAEDFGGFDGATASTAVGSKGLGITSVAFIPGRRATAVTVGANGKCCIIDFDKSQPSAASLVKSWHVRGPATSLSILSTGANSSEDQLDGPATDQNHSSGGLLLAIGRQDGRVVLYDLEGELTGEKTIDDDAARIIDVEWLEGSDGDERSSQRSGNVTPKAVRRKLRTSGTRKSLGSIMAKGRTIEEEVVVVLGDGEQVPLAGAGSEQMPEDRPTPPSIRDFALPTTSNYLDSFSPVKTTKPDEPEAAPQAALPVDDDSWTMSSSSSDRVPDSSTDSGSTIKRRKTPPAVPARPTPRKNGKLAVRRAQTMSQIKVHSPSQDSESDRILANVRSAGLALFAPYMQNKLLKETFVPSSLTTTTASLKSKPLPNQPEKAEAEDIWTDIIAEPRRRPSKSSSVISTKSRKTVSFQTASPGPSETSNDTIIDWATSSVQPRSLRPSILPQIDEQPPPPPPKPQAPGKAHHSIRDGDSVLSATNTTSSPATDTIIDWEPHPSFTIHADPPRPSPPPDPEKYCPGPQHRPSTTSTSTNPLLPSPALSIQPLAPTSHNHSRTQSSPSPSTSFSHKPNPPRLPSHASSQSTRHSDIATEVARQQGSLREELGAFQAMMVLEFGKQKEWFEGRVQELEEGGRRLEDENRRLREELGRVGGR